VNGSINGFDIDPFVLALTEPGGVWRRVPRVSAAELGDITGDGTVDAFRYSIRSWSC